MTRWLHALGRQTLPALFAALAWTASASTGSEQAPVIVIVATGGTIAGVQNDPEDPTRYRAGTLSAEEIAASVPGLADHARIESVQFANLASTRITPLHWLDMARQINAILQARDDVAGVVVTHGTDRLEETAFFLHLTVRSEKPVVVVGAQRPATDISADGPANLLAAVRTAATPAARGKGTLVVMDGRIVSAREVRKNYQRVGGFSGSDMGMLGIVGARAVEFFFTPVRRHGADSEFDTSELHDLPDVDLRFAYPGGSGPEYGVAPAGVVVASTGFTCAETLRYLELARTGTIVVAAFPTGENLGTIHERREPEVPARVQEYCPEVAAADWTGPWIPPIPVQHLTPQKARILLMLALAHSNDYDRIRQVFESY